MKIKTEELIAELINASKRNISTVKKFKEVPLIKLNRKESTDKWSVLECIEHLNLYGDFYNPEVKKIVKNGINRFEVRMPSDHVAILVRRGL